MINFQNKITEKIGEFYGRDVWNGFADECAVNLSLVVDEAITNQIAEQLWIRAGDQIVNVLENKFGVNQLTANENRFDNF